MKPTSQEAKWNQTHFELSNGYKFSIAHNLQYPSEINAAFDNWLVRKRLKGYANFYAFTMEEIRKYK